MSGGFFEQALDFLGIQYSQNRKSIILKSCHNCGNEKYKVWMFRPVSSKSDPNGSRTNGSCWVCGFKYSGFKYLLNYAPVEKVRELLGIEDFKIRHFDGSVDDMIKSFDEFLESLEDTQQNIFKPTIQEEDSGVDLPPHYLRVSESRNSPEGKYARSRGVIGHLQDQVFIDDRSHSVVFPLWSKTETLVGFQERYLVAKTFQDKLSGKQISIKCKTLGGVQKSKGVIICGDTSDPICLTEGPFDAAAAVWYGYCGVATMGASCSKDQLALILSYVSENKKPLYIGYDTDKAGESGAKKVAMMCDAIGVSFTRVVPFAVGEDFGSMLEKHAGFNVSIQDRVIKLKGMVRELHNWRWDIPY